MQRVFLIVVPRLGARVIIRFRRLLVAHLRDIDFNYVRSLYPCLIDGLVVQCHSDIAKIIDMIWDFQQVDDLTFDNVYDFDIVVESLGDAL